MRIVVLHSAVPPEAPPDEQDVLVQAHFIGEALTRLGCQVSFLPFASHLEAVRCSLRGLRPDLVFNLVETVQGTGRLLHVAPGLLDAEGLPYTGCPTEALFCTSHKVLTKKWLTACGLPTPEWFLPESPSEDFGSGVDTTIGTLRAPLPKALEGSSLEAFSENDLVIVKPVWEDASVGIDQEAVVAVSDAKALKRAVARAREQFGSNGFFVERFIDGREFNLSLLADAGGLEVLAPAEMCFEGFGPHRHRIVDYEAKWAVGSFAERHTVRSFAFSPEDRPLVERLSALARRCWDVFGLQGYARIDFRVDAQGRPWILEINANPCLSPDAGFMAAARQSGLHEDAVMRRILDDALTRRTKGHPGMAPTDRIGPRIEPVAFGDDEAALTLRHYLLPSDVNAVERITAETGFFNAEEIFVATDLARQSLNLGPDSGYFFIVAEISGHIVGYTCYGPIAGTAGRFDLYWIVVDPAYQGRGIGRRLLEESERAIRNAGGRRVYVETSSRTIYEPTRRFYLRAGYAFVASLPDFYGPEDHKIIYGKNLH